MAVLGLTGGIATGKTTFSQSFLRTLPECRHFDADRCVHDLLAQDTSVRDKVVEAFGSGVLDVTGFPSREKLRAIVFGNSELRKALEGIIHPEVRQRWESQSTDARMSGTMLLGLYLSCRLVFYGFDVLPIGRFNLK